MEFKCLTNIETSFRQLRMYALVFAGICDLLVKTGAETPQKQENATL